ncbi:MAG TPA: PAS domain S-box protein [Myxococcales bacterium]|jgi:PAS domain S-box-containing protein
MSDQSALLARIEALESELARVRRAAEQELSLSQEKFSKAFHASPDAVNITRLHDGAYLAINPGFTALTGYTEADVLGHSSLNLDIWSRPEDRDQLIGGLRQSGAVQDLVAPFRYKDGGVRMGSMSARILEIDGVPCILSITRDISERIAAEERVRQSEERLRLLIELAVDGILLGDPRGVITGANAGLCELLETPAERLVGRHISEIIAPESLRERPLRFDLLDAGGPLANERMLVNAGGQRVPVEMKSGRLPDGTYHSIIRDIRDRLRAQKEREALADRLRQAERAEALGRLAGGIAHDFNNLLTPILGAASLLADTVASDPEARSEVALIVEAAHRASELVRQILVFSRKQPVDLRPVDLGEVVCDTQRMLGRMLPENIRIERELAPDLPAILADRSQLQQVLLNLAANARDAMPAGGTLRLRTLQRDGRVCLEVRDDGAGMDEATQRQAFEPFFTTKSPGQGTGLGLAAVRAIVQGHGGTVAVASELGRGATFTLCFPASERSGAPEPASARPSRRLRGDERVLLVEDDASVRSAVQRMLQSDGYQVLAAADGQEALQLARGLQDPPHLLLTDVVMPGLSGPELRERLAALFPALKVLFISGHSYGLVAPEELRKRGWRLLPKPFSAQALSTAIREVLDG